MLLVTTSHVAIDVYDHAECEFHHLIQNLFDKRIRLLFLSGLHQCQLVYGGRLADLALV